MCVLNYVKCYENCRVLLISYLCDLSPKPMQKFVTERCYCPVLLSTEIKTKMKLEMEVDFFTAPQTENLSCDYKLGILLC